MDLIFTHIYEHARAAMDLSRDEYALCNYIATWSANPASPRAGWCNRTLSQKAAFIGITERGITKMQNRLIELGLIEKDPITAHTRTTVAWFEMVNAAKSREQSFVVQVEQSSDGQGTKFRRKREQSSVNGGNKVPAHNNVSLFNQNNDFVVIDGEAVELNPVDAVVDFLNENLQPARPFSKTTKKTVEVINARLREKYTVDDICLVIEHKITQWKGDTKMEQYLRPETLFGTGKFESYLVAATTWAASGKIKNGHGNGNRNGAPTIDHASTAGAFAEH